MEFAKLKKEYADHLRVLVRRRGRLRHINFDYPLRVKLGVLVLVFFSLVSSWGLFKKNQKEFDPKLDFSGHNGVTLYERRFLEAKTMLPAQGVVGYVSDAQLDGAEFYLTQYALAPLIVDKTQPHELIVGNFASQGVEVGKLTSMSLTLRKDFGNGIKLFSGEPR